MILSMASHVDSSAGPMYRLQPFYDPNENIELSQTMYSLDSVYGNSQPVNKSDDLTQLEQRQDAIFSRLAALKEEVDNLSNKSKGSRGSTAASSSASVRSAGPAMDLGKVVKDIVINANPNSVPYGLLILKDQLEKHYKVMTSSHVHSSARDTPEKLRNVFQTNGNAMERGSSQLAFTLIWKDEKYGPSMMINPSTHTSIQGETSIARYFSRLMDTGFDTDLLRAARVDTWLDLSATIINGNNKEKMSCLKTANAQLGKNAWLVDQDGPCVADILFWSAIARAGLSAKAPNNVKTWFEACSNKAMFNSATRLL